MILRHQSLAVLPVYPNAIHPLEAARQPAATAAANAAVALHIHRLQGEMPLAAVQGQGLPGLKAGERRHDFAAVGRAVGGQTDQFITFTLGELRQFGQWKHQ